MEGIVTSKEYSINYYDIDYKRKALITSIINYFGDLSMYQSDTLGVGMDYLEQNKLAWVLYKWDITIDRYPLYGEKIVIKTIPHSFRKFYAYRRYEILDSNGCIIGRANSTWFLINTEKRRPIRVSDGFYKAYGIDENANDEIVIDSIEDFEEVHSDKEFVVRYSDIDTNRHVNNAKYVSWAIESVPLDMVLHYTLKRIKVEYLKETTYGHVIKALTEINEMEDRIVCRHKIVNDEGKKLTLLESTWEK